jgi:hypothetical protein
MQIVDPADVALHRLIVDVAVADEEIVGEMGNIRHRRKPRSARTGDLWETGPMYHQARSIDAAVSENWIKCFPRVGSRLAPSIY